MNRAFPKPVRPPREPKPIKRKAQLRARRWGVSRGPSKTKHGRRERDFGRMGKLAEKDCAVWNWFLSLPHARIKALIAEGFDGCAGRVEVAHLSLGKTAGRRRAPDSQTAPICTSHHRQPGIDGGIGGKAPWYVALGYDGQQELRRWLIDWSDAQLAGVA